jgi:hypothetical protein
MPNYNNTTQEQLVHTRLGFRVDRATSVTPQHGGTDDVTYFTVAGGKVLMTLLVGEITTVFGGGANAMQISFTPTAGTAAVLCATEDLASYAEGDILTIDGLITTKLLPATTAGASPAMAYGGVVLVPGALKFGAAGATTGNWKWQLWYVPIDDGAYVVAN